MSILRFRGNSSDTIARHKQPHEWFFLGVFVAGLSLRRRCDMKKGVLQEKPSSFIRSRLLDKTFPEDNTRPRGSMILGLLAVGILWGVTIPLMRDGGLAADGDKAPEFDEKDKLSSSGKKLRGGIVGCFLSLLRLLIQWRVLVPYLLNQCGSLCYYYLLGEYDLSITAPLANTLAFFFTFLTEAIMKKALPSAQEIVGCALIVFGFAICVSD
ncbi:family UPF0546 protein [Toxoplasma gondii ARI]|uniref:Family UPF0546 protein n=2 Tax=Toxoplasma gondii TaxID=5811 RepID=A0A2G8XZH3_TOXGO|nr:family UPF0546 protein [Toxoplasma gondii ARI]PIM00139.1 family UPF0546 protein [Toxoplasma gondii COUG]